MMRTIFVLAVLLPAVSFGQGLGLWRILLGGGGAPQQGRQQQNSQATIYITGPSWCGPCKSEWQGGRVPNVEALEIVNSNGEAWIFPKKIFGNSEFLRPVDSSLVSRYGGVKTKKYQGSVPTTGAMPRSALPSQDIGSQPPAGGGGRQQPKKPVVDYINIYDKTAERYAGLKALASSGKIELREYRKCESRSSKIYGDYYVCSSRDGHTISITKETYEAAFITGKKNNFVIYLINEKGTTVEKIDELIKKYNVGGGGNRGGGEPKFTPEDIDIKIKKLRDSGKTYEEIKNELQKLFLEMSDGDLQKLSQGL